MINKLLNNKPLIVDSRENRPVKVYQDGFILRMPQLGAQMMQIGNNIKAGSLLSPAKSQLLLRT